jgi:hypothetical protein
MNLPAAAAGDDHEVIVKRGNTAHVEDEDVLTFMVLGGAGAQDGVFQAG